MNAKHHKRWLERNTDFARGAVYFALYLLMLQLHEGISHMSKSAVRSPSRFAQFIRSLPQPRGWRQFDLTAVRNSGWYTSLAKATARISSARPAFPRLTKVTEAVPTVSTAHNGAKPLASHQVVTVPVLSPVQPTFAHVTRSADMPEETPDHSSSPVVTVDPDTRGANDDTPTEHVTIALSDNPKQHPSRPHRTLWRLGLIASIVVILLVGVRTTAAYIGANNTLVVHIDNQQPVIVDPRASAPRSPYIFGVNAFPEEGTQALNGAYGFMPYDAKTVSGLTGAGITMLRFPGGDWGEQNPVSYQQIAAFLTLAKNSHATPLMAVRLTNGSPEQAAAMVSFTNRTNDPNRKITPNMPNLPVFYWVIGNEPDLIGPNYTVAQYVQDFTAYAAAMKAVDPRIQIYGPEISALDGPTGSLDASGTPWLTGFLKGVASYEKSHHTTILDGLSFHSYAFGNASANVGLLLSSSDVWRYTLSQIRLEIQQLMGRSIPIAITEINTNTQGSSDPLATALWWADSLGVLQEEQVNIVNFFAARGLQQQDMLMNIGGAPTPIYYAMRMYTHMEPNVIQVGSAPGPVSIYASVNSSNNTLSLMFVNKSPFTAAVAIDPGQALSRWHSARIKAPAYSIDCVVLHSDGTGQEYIYAPTPSMLANGNAGTISVQSVDAAGPFA